MEGIVFLVVLAFGFGAGKVHEIEKSKTEQKQECSVQCINDHK